MGKQENKTNTSEGSVGLSQEELEAIDAKIAQVKNLDAELEEKQAKLAALDAEIDAKLVKVSELDAEVAELDQLIEAKQEELDTVQDELDNAKDSKSDKAPEKTSLKIEEVEVSFAAPAFRSEGKEYRSSDVEKAVEAEEPWALTLVKKLIEKKSGVIKVVSLEEEGGK